jgi:hypothetical protein
MALPVDYLYDGDERLLSPPRDHPSAGFSDMLRAVEEETDKLRQERDKLGPRLVNVRTLFAGQYAAAVVTMSNSPPGSFLTFRLENDEGDGCRTESETTWEKTTETEEFADRAREFLSKEGFGDVYVGRAMVTFNGCPLGGNEFYLVLCEGDERTNRIKL